MFQLNAYLGFDGTCAEAMRFYERTLGGKIQGMLTYAQAPAGAEMPQNKSDRIMHARLVFDGGGVLMAGDAPPGMPYEGMKGISLTLTYPTAEESVKVFNALSEGGKVTMPLQKTFWAESFGMLTDRFGTPWIVNGGMTA